MIDEPASDKLFIPSAVIEILLNNIPTKILLEHNSMLQNMPSILLNFPYDSLTLEFEMFS